jgi:hypothetical protein
MAVAGMVCGIVGLVLFFLGFIGMLVSLLGIIFGAIGLAKSKRVGKGKGAALTGLICGALGLVVAILMYVIAIMAFTSYMQKSKTSEAQLQLRKIETRVKTFHVEQQRLPPSASDMPAAPGCAEPKHPMRSQSDWFAAGGWREMDFTLDEPSRYTYRWVAEVPTGANAHGYALAIGDLDCDGTLSTLRLDITKVEGNLQATYSGPTDD